MRPLAIRRACTTQSTSPQHDRRSRLWRRAKRMRPLVVTLMAQALRRYPPSSSRPPVSMRARRSQTGRVGYRVSLSFEHFHCSHANIVILEAVFHLGLLLKRWSFIARYPCAILPDSICQDEKFNPERSNQRQNMGRVRLSRESGLGHCSLSHHRALAIPQSLKAISEPDDMIRWRGNRDPSDFEADNPMQPDRPLQTQNAGPRRDFDARFRLRTGRPSRPR